MKKILPVLILFALVLPVVVFAQGTLPEGCTIAGDLSDIDPACFEGAFVSETVTDAWGACCAVNTIVRIADFIFIVLVFLAVIFFLLGAFTLITGAGAPEKVASGRSYILYAVFGLAAALLARAVPAIARFLIGA